MPREQRHQQGVDEAPGVECQVPGVRRQATGDGRGESGVRRQASGVRQFAICAALMSLLGLSVQALADETPSLRRWLVPVKGERAAATLISISPDGEATFAAERGTRRFALGELVAWGSPAEPRALVQLSLADGGIIPLANNTRPTTVQDHLLAVSDTFGELKLSLSLLAGVLFHSPIDPQRRDRLSALVSLPPAVRGQDPSTGVDNRDRLLLENGDELRGRIVALTETVVEFEADVGPLSVELEHVVAAAFDPSLRAKPVEAAPRSLVGFADGSLLAAKSIVVSDGGAELTLADDSRLVAAGGGPISLQPQFGQVQYLSDLRPASHRHIPYLGVPWDYRLDANVDGTRLRAGGKLYPKGVGMHSAARLTWQLDMPYRRFEAELAIDDQTELGGSVVFRVFSGSREIYKSRVVRGGEEPLPISVDIRDARQLSLVVDCADRADVLDHADWLNARLTP